jgi:hypothetical protein
LTQKRLDGLKPELQAAVFAAVFADFDKMVAHMARTHGLHQDEIALLMASWFNSQPGCLQVNVNDKV